jgi:hypothetical protein
MSLKLSDFSKWIQVGDKIDYIEVRHGEQLVIPFTMRDSSDGIVDLSGWTLTVNSEIMSATFTYSTAGELTGVADLTKQRNASGNTGSTAVAGLEVVNIVAAAGTGVLKIPASATPNPSTLITPDDNNTLLNIITITATYPSSVTGFSNIRKLMMGLIVRYSN